MFWITCNQCKDALNQTIVLLNSPLLKTLETIKQIIGRSSANTCMTLSQIQRSDGKNSKQTRA
jgi:hypothetical protein